MSDGREPPEAVPVPRSRFLPELIWAVPIVAVLIGGWLAVRAIRARGPVITISFLNAAGLEAGKTKLRYRDVDVGEVRDIRFSPDLKMVVVTAEMVHDAAPFLVEDTRFWVVRAEIAAGRVSGLGTLLSGAYIGADVGTSKRPRRAFEGLEEEPIVSGGTPGRAFVAHSARAIGPGSPIFLHGQQVGQVTTSDLDADGRQVSIGMFVRAPFDRFVTTDTRFWNAGGFRASLDASGVKLEVQSLVTLLIGGISFEPGPEHVDAAPAPPGHRFVLYQDRDDAMKLHNIEGQDYVVVFKQSVRGLAIGAPVEFRGMSFGEVTNIGLDYDPVSLEFTAPVTVRLYFDRLNARMRQGSLAETASSPEARLRRFVEHGLRAQLQSGSLLTGQRFVALDFFPGAPPVKVDLVHHPREIPAMTADDLQATLANVAHKIDRIPFQDVGPLIDDVRQVVAKAGMTISDVNTAVKELGPMSPRGADIDDVLQQMARAARSVRALAESLERHPESLIRGRR